MIFRWTVTLVMGLGMVGGGVAEAQQREITAAAVNIATDIAAGSKRSVAVVDFTDLQGTVTELGRFVAEEMALGLVMARKNLSVIDRTHLRTLMEENKLGTTGLIDPATARKLGKIIGVEVLVTGTITPFPDSVRVVIKVLDTDTATILAADSMDIAKTQTIESLLSRDINRAGPASTSAPRPSASGAASAPSRPPAVSGAPVFQRGPLRVTVGQLAAAKGNVSLSLTIENISAEPQYLAFSGYSDPAVSLTDNMAAEYSLNQHNGIPVVQNAGTTKERNSFVRLEPGEGLNQLFTFRHGHEYGGTVFSFSTVVWVWSEKGSQVATSVGLSGIPSSVGK